MFRFLLPIMSLLLSSVCFAHTCQPLMTLDKQLNDSKRAFLVYVLETRLEEELQGKMIEKDGGADPESVKLVSAGYRIVEDYKGEKSYRPRLLDILGIGTGYVGLTPGVYYLVFLGDLQTYETPDMRVVDICTVPVAHHRWDVPQFQKKLDEVRALVNRKK
jgi:hypothetical protein